MIGITMNAGAHASYGRSCGDRPDRSPINSPCTAPGHPFKNALWCRPLTRQVWLKSHTCAANLQCWVRAVHLSGYCPLDTAVEPPLRRRKRRRRRRRQRCIIC